MELFDKEWSFIGAMQGALIGCVLVLAYRVVRSYFAFLKEHRWRVANVEKVVAAVIDHEKKKRLYEKVEYKQTSPQQTPLQKVPTTFKESAVANPFVEINSPEKKKQEAPSKGPEIKELILTQPTGKRKNKRLVPLDSISTSLNKEGYLESGAESRPDFNKVRFRYFDTEHMERDFDQGISAQWRD